MKYIEMQMIKRIETRLLIYALIGGAIYLITPREEIYEVIVLLLFSIVTIVDIWNTTRPNSQKGE